MVKVINPDNERDIRVATMINFIPLGKSAATTRSKPSNNYSSDYKGAHGFLLTYRGSLNAPIGIGIGGIGKKMGFYGSFRFSLRPEGYGETVYTSNSNHEITDGTGEVFVYTQYQTESRGAFVVGPIIPLNEYLSFFGGIGLGWSNQWELYDVYDSFDQELDFDDNQVYAINEDESISAGFEFEFGAMVHWKVLTATAGLSMVNFSSPDFVMGIGFLFH